jgi:hypothetical protein
MSVTAPLRWCALATASHSCRLWGPTTSLTHPLHTYIPHICKEEKFHKCKCLLFNVCMYTTSCSGDSLPREREDGVIHRSRVRISNPRTSDRFTHPCQVTARRNVFQCIHSYIHTVLLLTLYCIMFCTILSIAEFFSRPFSLHWPSLS